MDDLTIGQLAQQVSVSIETIRYYERCGLIPEPPRRDSGYRKYSRDFVTRIRFIRRAQKLGFSLKEIKELLDLRIESEAVCDGVKVQAQTKLADIEAKIQMLQRIRQTLTGLVKACEENQLTAECPILKALDE